jgi:hypothetical protein
VLGLPWPAINWDTHQINIEAQLHYDTAEHGCPENDRCVWRLRPCPPSEPCSGDPVHGSNGGTRVCRRPAKPTLD